MPILDGEMYMKKWELKAVTEPNLVDEMFPHVTPPRIVFDGPITEQVNGQTLSYDLKDRAGRC